jgi:GT2 family glycosyltransferase
MATKVLELDLAQIPRAIGDLEGYGSVLILLRHKRRPFMKVQLPVRNGEVKGSEVVEEVLLRFGADGCQVWLESMLETEPAWERRSFEGPVTVAICTRERPDDLSRCLGSLEKLPKDGQEILVVDNRPRTRETEKVVRAHSGVRYVREDRRGLDAARNRALREARGEIVAFIDDDAVADREWLRALAGNFGDPLTLAVTGMTMPIELETRAQETFERLTGFCRGFRRRRFQMENLSPVAGGSAGAGANMALRRDVLEKVGPFDEALDAGTPTCSGGDSEYFSRILAAGFEIVYEPAALNWHRHRRSWGELRDTMFGYGVGVYASWTRSFLVGRDWDVPGAAWRWFFRVQLRRAARSICRRPGAYPLDLVLAELAGSVLGPLAYLRSRLGVG